MSEIPTLAVPAALYDEALAFCNARLAEDGKPAVESLPPGFCRRIDSCPCASAAPNVYVAGGGEWWRVPSVVAGIQTGGPLGFTRYFDSHADEDVLTLPVRDATLLVVTLPVPS